MKTSDFLELIVARLELEDSDLTVETDLTSLSEYDSLAVMTLIAVVDENFGVKLSTDALDSITTVHSLCQLIGKKHFD